MPPSEAVNDSECNKSRNSEIVMQEAKPLKTTTATITITTTTTTNSTTNSGSINIIEVRCIHVCMLCCECEVIVLCNVHCVLCDVYYVASCVVICVK